jgi:hypothetical protein
MKTLRSALTLLAVTTFASAGVFAHPTPFAGDTPGYARDDEKPVYQGIGHNMEDELSLESITLSTDCLDPVDGFGQWGLGGAGEQQPGEGAPYSGSRPR